MPNKNKMNGRRMNGKRRSRRNNGFINRGLAPRGRSHPTLVLKAKTIINNTISGVNVKQINILPTADIFGADVLQQFKFF